VDGLRAALERRVPVSVEPLPQPYERVVCFELERGGQRHRVALDYADKSELHPACAERSLVYLKMQFRRGGYAGHPNVIPAGYVSGNHDVYRYLAPVRALRDRRDFRWDVNARFGLRFSAELRTRAVQLLSAQPGLRFHGGTHLVRYSRHLREIARSKICVDLPGNGAFCFRLVDYLAVGACVVAVRHANQLPVELIDGEQIVWVKEDLSDLVSKCEELIRDDGRRERIARNARRYFDVHLQEQVLADYYLERMFAAVRGEGLASEPIAASRSA
jgi:hypothetical protein